MDVRARKGAGAPRRLFPAAGLFTVLLAMVLTSALTSCASAVSGRDHREHTTPAPARQPVATVVRTFSPYDATGKISARISDTTTGECWTSSVAAAGAPNAYRCLAGNKILDPCFVAAGVAGAGRTAVCVPDPWSDAVVLNLTGDLPDNPPLGDGTRPWALQFADGLRCVASTGTVPVVGGVPLAYQCLDGTAAAVPDPTANVVTAEVGRTDGAALRQVKVTALWRG